MFFPYPYEWRRGDTVFMCCMISGLLLFFVWIGSMMWADINRLEEQEREVRERWVGSQLVRICRSGHRIYKLRDGSHWTGVYGDHVSGPEVCQ